MKNISIPNKKYFKKAKEIILRIVNNSGNKEFNNIRRSIYGNKDLLRLMNDNGIEIDEISSGVSDRKAYQGYIKQIISDLRKGNYYRSYYPSRGNEDARGALSIYENYKLKPPISYTTDNFCLTEGSTGAITMIFEYFKKYFPDKEILIQSPNYYLYKFAANYYNLKLKEVKPVLKKDDYSFIKSENIIKNINKNTKLIIITNPANPSGELFTRKDLTNILTLAKEKNIFVLVDELFSELIFEPKEYVYSDVVASTIDAMGNLIIVKGYSKSKNLVGLRIGYLYSKNVKLIEGISFIAQQRSSYSVASNFTGLISLDCFVQSVRINSISKISKVIKDFRKIPTVKNKKNSELIKEYSSYEKYFTSLMKYYSERYDDVVKILNQDIDFKFLKKSAFNTIVKISGLKGINSFDFMVNCFLTTGLKTEIGPCFGFRQKTWDDEFGFWLRLTFAKDKQKFKKRLMTFKKFKTLYLSNKDKFIKTNFSF